MHSTTAVSSEACAKGRHERQQFLDKSEAAEQPEGRPRQLLWDLDFLWKFFGEEGSVYVCQSLALNSLHTETRIFSSVFIARGRQ